MRIHLSFVVLLGLCAANVGAQQIENPANGHLYQVIPPAQFDNLKQAAENLGGYLVTINDAAENQWLLETFFFTGGDVSDAIIGYTDEVVEGTFVWLSGEPVTYTSWNAGEPNDAGGEDVTELDLDGSWNDISRNLVQRGIAEIIPVFQFTQTFGTFAVEEGSPISFSVTVASPDSTTFTYQWYKNAVAEGGATDSTYTPTLSATAGDDGDEYYVVADDTFTTIQSGTFVINVLPAGSLPVAGLLGLMALGAGVAAAGAAALRRKG